MGIHLIVNKTKESDVDNSFSVQSLKRFLKPEYYCKVCEEVTDVDVELLECIRVIWCSECGTDYNIELNVYADGSDGEDILWSVISDREMELQKEVEQKHVSVGMVKELTELALRLREGPFDCSRCKEKTEVAEFPRGVSPAEVCCHRCYMPYQHADNWSRINWMYDRITDLNKRIAKFDADK